MKKVKTVNAYIDENMENLDAKIITVYNDDKNIIWRGKAEYAPLYLKMELRSVETRMVDTIDGDTVEEVIINGDVEHKKEETMEEATTRAIEKGIGEVIACIEFDNPLKDTIKIIEI